MLLKMRKEFYRMAKEQQARSSIKGYLFGDANDETRTRAFVDMLLLHEIEVYEVNSNTTADGKIFEAGKSFLCSCCAG